MTGEKFQNDLSSNVKDEIRRLTGVTSLLFADIKLSTQNAGPGLLSRYNDMLRTGRSGDRILVVVEILHTRPDRPWGPTSLIYNGYRVFLGGKAAGMWR
jgi:hypothetical protein